MSAIERLTITLPSGMAGVVKGAVRDGDYASASEVIREALRDWKMKRELQLHRLAERKAEIDRSIADATEGRLTDFDSELIVARKAMPGLEANRMDKTLRKYSSFDAMKDAEYREWQALPASVRLDAAGELSTMQYSWKSQDVQPGLQRTLVRVQQAPR
jgi:antitoxin ParD1/3/4